MKVKTYFLVILLSVLLSACAGVNNNVDTIVLDQAAVSNAQSRLNNDTVSFGDIFVANLQGVPIVPIGSKIGEVHTTVLSAGLEIVVMDANTIIVLGSPKPQKSGNATVTSNSVEKFVYRFSDDLLVAGPNLISKD
ncbi:hypothetical protein [Sessilibacter corallicola]